VVLVAFKSSFDILDSGPPKLLQRLQYADISRYGAIPGSGSLLPRFRVCITTLSGIEVTYTFETSNAAQLHTTIKTAIQQLLN
jgi:hypothetical protein